MCKFIKISFFRCQISLFDLKIGTGEIQTVGMKNCQWIMHVSKSVLSQDVQYSRVVLKCNLETEIMKLKRELETDKEQASYFEIFKRYLTIRIVILMLVLLGLLIVLSSGSAVAPFIYTLF